MYLSKYQSIAQISALASMGAVHDLQTLSDEALLELSQRSPSAFEHLIGRYQRQFLARAQSVTGSRDTAEDVVQDAFIRIYRFAPKFNGDAGSFRSWSLTILMNVARTHYRKTARDRDHLAPLKPDHYESLKDDTILERGGIEEESQDTIRKALARASEDVAEILTLAFIDDLPYKDIAQKLGLSVAAVKTRVHRAKAVLRDIINNQEKT